MALAENVPRNLQPVKGKLCKQHASRPCTPNSHMNFVERRFRILCGGCELYGTNPRHDCIETDTERNIAVSHPAEGSRVQFPNRTAFL